MLAAIKKNAAGIKKDPIEQQDPLRKKILGLQHILVETLAAQLAVLPLVVFLFGRVSIISPLANIFVLIAVPSAMAAGLFAGLAGLVSPLLGHITALPAWLLSIYMIRAIGFFAALPGAAVEVGAWAAVPLAFIPLAIVFFGRRAGKKLTTPFIADKEEGADDEKYGKKQKYDERIDERMMEDD